MSCVPLLIVEAEFHSNHPCHVGIKEETEGREEGGQEEREGGVAGSLDQG